MPWHFVMINDYYSNSSEVIQTNIKIGNEVQLLKQFDYSGWS